MRPIATPCLSVQALIVLCRKQNDRAIDLITQHIHTKLQPTCPLWSPAVHLTSQQAVLCRNQNDVAIDLITQHIHMKLQQPDLQRIYHNLVCACCPKRPFHSVLGIGHWHAV